jgi:hypothetical protein
VRGEKEVKDAILLGLAAARESVCVYEAVPRHLSWEMLVEKVEKEGRE